MTTKIIISGLTAAGKSTHSLLLSEALGIRSVHFTDLLLNELGIDAKAPDGVWFERMAEIDSMRAGGTADERVDSAIVDLLSGHEPVIVDAVLAPWMFHGKAIRIWLGSDRASRAWKCMVSRLPIAISTDNSLRLLDEKDSFTQSYLWSSKGVDLYSDRSVFDVVVDNSCLIDSPTRAAADFGIERLHEVLLAVVEFLLHPSDANERALHRDFGFPLSEVIAHCRGLRVNKPDRRFRLASRSV